MACEQFADDIIQMMPADGWMAEYKLDDGTLVRERVPMWGLTRDGIIWGMANCKGWFEVNDAINLVRFVHKDDLQPDKNDALDPSEPSSQGPHSSP